LINGTGDIDMGLVEKYIEIEKAHEDVCEYLRNKIRFIHENIGKDYRTDDSWFDSDYTILTEVRKEGEFVVVSYDYFRHIDYNDKLYIKKELLDMPEEEILKNKDTLKAELEAYNQEQLRLLEESKKEKELASKKREYERLMAQVQKLESEIGK
jgi:hypothetical protein